MLDPNPEGLDRRSFIAGIALGLVAAPLTAEAQPRGKTWRVGFLSGGARPPDGAPPLPLRQALRDLGYGEPQNVVYLGRWAEAKQERLPALAAELVELKVDVIVTVGGPASTAAKQATSSIPIVLALVGDADGIGLIASLARPGSNVTGVTDQSVELSAKRLEFLTEAVPKAARIAVLWNADDRGMTLRYREVEKAAQRLHVAVQPLGVREPDDFETAFSAMIQHRPDALLLVTDALTLLNRKRVIDFARVHRIPAMYEYNFLVAGRRTDVVRGEPGRQLPPGRELRGSDLQGSHPGLPAGRAARPVLPHDQPQDRQGAGPDDSADAAPPGGSGDRVTRCPLAPSSFDHFLVRSAMTVASVGKASGGGVRRGK